MCLCLSVFICLSVCLSRSLPLSFINIHTHLCIYIYIYIYTNQVFIYSKCCFLIVMTKYLIKSKQKWNQNQHKPQKTKRIYLSILAGISWWRQEHQAIGQTASFGIRERWMLVSTVFLLLIESGISVCRMMLPIFAVGLALSVKPLPEISLLMCIYFKHACDFKPSQVPSEGSWGNLFPKQFISHTDYSIFSNNESKLVIR